MPFKTKRRFVFVDDDQVPVNPREVAERVSASGFRDAAQYYGASESRLRLFLSQNGLKVVAQRSYMIIEGGVTTDGSQDTPASGGDTMHTAGA